MLNIKDPREGSGEELRRSDLVDSRLCFRDEKQRYSRYCLTVREKIHVSSFAKRKALSVAQDIVYANLQALVQSTKGEEDWSSLREDPCWSALFARVTRARWIFFLFLITLIIGRKLDDEQRNRRQARFRLEDLLPVVTSHTWQSFNNLRVLCRRSLFAAADGKFA